MMRKYLLIAIALVLMSGNVNAEIVTGSPESENGCGTNCSWSFDTQTGVLTVSGSENMGNYAGTYDQQKYRWRSNAPWRDFDDKITSVVVQDGISSIGVCAFEGLINLTSVNLPDSIQQIGYAAFYDARSLESITIPENENGTKLASNVFYGAFSLENLTLEGNIDVSRIKFLNLESKISTSLLTSIYCNKSNASCQRLLQDADFTDKIKFYERYNDQYFCDGKFYKSINDIESGKHIKKLRYTVEEAMKATEHGDKFHVSLTYK